MKYLISLLITGILALGACAPKPIPSTHYIVMKNIAIFQVSYGPDTVMIDSTLFCKHEVNTFVFRPDSVFLVDSLKHSEGYKVVGNPTKGVYVLSDDTPMPVALQITRFPLSKGDKPRVTVYFQKGRYILRLSEHTAVPCDKL